jgi:NTE family protein
MDIALALGGGGARGLAHIGVLKVLEKEGFKVRAVAGTSMGGVIAAAFASGLSPQEIAESADGLDIKGMLELRTGGPSVFGLNRIQAWLENLLGDRTFEDLLIPLAVTATDLTTCREVVLTEGKVVKAVMATIALPGLFPPQGFGESRLVDGGTLDPVPVLPARSLSAQPVVAVVLSPAAERWPETRSPSLMESLPWAQLVSRLRVVQAIEVFQQTLEITFRMHTELRLSLDKPEVLVRPDVWDVGLFDDPSLPYMIDKGQLAMLEALPALRAQFTWPRRLRRWLGSLWRSVMRSVR